MSKAHSHASKSASKSSSKSASKLKGAAHPASAPQPLGGEACRTPDSLARQLDEELDQSFPASDPPSMVRDTPATVCGPEETPKGEAHGGKKRHK